MENLENKALDLVDTYNQILNMEASKSDMKRENANINTNSPMGMMLKVGTESMKEYLEKTVLPKEFVDMNKDNFVHEHDLDFSLITFNCCQIDLARALKDGFSTGHGYIREPNSIRSAATLACIIIQSNQNDMFGGQSLMAFDIALSYYVKKSFYHLIIKHSYTALCYAHNINSFITFKDYSEAMKKELDISKIIYTEKERDKENRLISYKEISRAISKVLENYIFSQLSVNIVNIYDLACIDVEDETHQAMEAMVHNFCTLHCLPAYEKIWVYDTLTDKLTIMSMEELHKNFEHKRFKAISVNYETGKSELKYITAIERKDNHRNLVTIKDKAGRKVTVTDNHKVLYLNNNGKILDDYPDDITNVISPRKFNDIDVSDTIDISRFVTKKTKKVNTKIKVDPYFAKLAGYYVAEGNVSGGSSLVFTTCDSNKENELIELMNHVYGKDITYSRYPMPNDKSKPKNIMFNAGKVWCDAFKFLFGPSAHYKQIPIEILFSKDPMVKIQFLNGYLKCDGSIKHTAAISSTVSYLLSKQLHLLMLSLNELCTMNERDTFSNYGACHIYESTYSGNNLNRVGTEFDFDPMRFELRKYSYDFIKDLYYRNFEGRRPKTPLSKDMIDKQTSIDEKLKISSNVFSVPIKKRKNSNSGEIYVYDLSVEDNENFLTADSIFVHNSRSGSQTPFSSVNFGLGVNSESRLVSKELLNAIDAGLGHGETAIFPITIFTLKDGINYNENDPNYDLFIRACEVSAKRLFPK